MSMALNFRTGVGAYAMRAVERSDLFAVPVLHADLTAGISVDPKVRKILKPWRVDLR